MALGTSATSYLPHQKPPVFPNSSYEASLADEAGEETKMSLFHVVEAPLQDDGIRTPWRPARREPSAAVRHVALDQMFAAAEEWGLASRLREADAWAFRDDGKR
jgi:hypothetical protein